MDSDTIQNTISYDEQITEDQKDVIHDDKTDELVASIETGVDKAYTTIQDTTMSGFTKIQGLVAEKLPEFQKQWNDVKLPDMQQFPKAIVDVDELKKKINIEGYVKTENIQQLKAKSGEILSKAGENTNKVLDDIDNDLERLENLTIDYAKQIGGQVGSFFKTQLDQFETKNSETDKDSTKSSWGWGAWGKQLTDLVVGETPEKTLKEEAKTELIFNIPETIVAGSRAEIEIKELQSKESFFVEAVKSNEFKDFTITKENEEEIKELLANESLQLVKIYNKLVKAADSEEENESSKLSSDDFWKVYFGKRGKIIEAEKKRKALLEKSAVVENNNVEEDDEDFDWD